MKPIRILLPIALLAALQHEPGRRRRSLRRGHTARTRPALSTDATTNPVRTQSTAPAEAGALSVLVAVNEHEIAAAEQARGKNVDGPTLEYANQMHTEHSKNLAETRALMGSSSDAANDEVGAQKQKSEAELAALAPLSGDAYEKAYIDAMVTGHAEVLGMLDTKLIPAAQTAGVQQHLAATRERVAMHLEKARELQASTTR